MIFYWSFKREKEKKVWPICKFLVDFLENLRHWPSGGRKWANEGGKKVESPLHYDGKMDLLGGCKEVGQEDVNNNTSAGQTRGANLTILDKHFFFFIFVFYNLKINTGNFDQKSKKRLPNNSNFMNHYVSSRGHVLCLNGIVNIMVSLRGACITTTEGDLLKQVLPWFGVKISLLILSWHRC